MQAVGRCSSFHKFVLQLLKTDQISDYQQSQKPYQCDYFDQLIKSSSQIKPFLDSTPEIEQDIEIQDLNLKKETIYDDSEQEEVKSVQCKPIIRKRKSQKLNKKINSQVQCRCSKSQCQKQYCECFTMGVACSDQCQCVNCGNQEAPRKMRIKKSRKTIVTCTCKKSNCVKRYCECYLNGQICSQNCRCNDCQNTKSENLRVMGQLSGDLMLNHDLVTRLNKLRRNM